MAYHRGILEIIMPSKQHEFYKELISELIKDLATELEIDYLPLGSTTWKRKDLAKVRSLITAFIFRMNLLFVTMYLMRLTCPNTHRQI